MEGAREHFRILGDVGSPVFAFGIARHVAQLGLSGRFVAQGKRLVEVVVTGPQEIWVERIGRAVL